MTDNLERDHSLQETADRMAAADAEIKRVNAKLGATLTEGELAALRDLAAPAPCTIKGSILFSLSDKGLIEIGDPMTNITALGRQALSTADTTETEMATDLTGKELDERLLELIEKFVHNDHFENLADDLSVICTDEQWDIVCATLDQAEVDLKENPFDSNIETTCLYCNMPLSDCFCPPQAPATVASGQGAEVPDVLDVDVFEHAIASMYADLMMGRKIGEYRVDDVQSAHDEIVGDLRTANAALTAKLAGAVGALEEAQDLARDGQGEWASVDPVYQPEWCKPFADIEDTASKALAALKDGEA